MTLNAVLTWNDESSAESQFRIYRSQAPSPTWKDDFSQLDTLSADTESYTDTDIPKVGSLTYAVVAVNLAGESDPSISSTLDTTDQNILFSVEDSETTSVSISRTRTLELGVTEQSTLSVRLSRFPLVSEYTQSKDDDLQVEYPHQNSEVNYIVPDHEVKYNMPDRKFHKKTDKPLKGDIPRDLTGATVTVLWGEDEQEYDTVSFIDRQGGEVKAGIKEIDPDLGYHELHWKITYEDGTVEVLPPEADTIEVTE